MGMEYMGADKHKAYLFAYKQDKLVAGPNIEITPNEDGKTATISASGGEGTVTDVLVDGVSVVNQDGEAEFSTMTGATSQMAGEGGLVPTPAIADRNKYLKGDGTWGEVSTVGDLEDLGDVTITNPADGESLVYDADNDEWVNREIGGAVDDIVMNGQSIVSNKVARFQNYVELTQSEYDALPDSKLTDGILYCIKDTGIVEGEKFAPVIYSLEEREIGVWTDGKPLYQKSFLIPASTITGDNTFTIPLGLQDVDKVIDYNAIIMLTGTNRFARLPLSLDTKPISVQNEYSYNLQYYDKTTDILRIDIGSQTSHQGGYGTIWYTKTTDVPGSGKWGTDGIPKFLYGSTVPTLDLGSERETYIKTDGTTIESVYYKINGAWLVGLANNLYFPGDKYIVSQSATSNRLVQYGWVTSSNTVVRFEFIVPKSLKNITKITVKTMMSNFRTYNGNYILSSGFVSGGVNVLEIFDFVVHVVDETRLEFMLTKKSGSLSTTNNSLLSIEIHEFELEFS